MMRFERAAHAALAASALLVAGPRPLSAAQEGGGGLFAVDPGLAVWTILVFLMVLWILGRYAWKPILGALDAREGGIRNSIDQATAMRDEAAELLEEHRKQLADARRQAQEIVAEGRSAAERLGREIQDKARQEGDRIVERARGEIEREKDAALAQIREESVELALAAASHILRERLTDEKDRALVKGFLSELDPPAAEA
jgi:F-type H+-transporting ATPase subunit b